MKRAIALTLLMGLVIQVEGQSVPSAYALTWMPALSMTDGTPFDESQIEGYPLYCDGNYVKTIPNDFTRRTVVDVSILGAGDHTCGLSEIVGGIESVMSDTVSFPLGQRTPGSPTGLQAQGV